jgi:hypothetical protein
MGTRRRDWSWERDIQAPLNELIASGPPKSGEPSTHWLLTGNEVSLQSPMYEFRFEAVWIRGEWILVQWDETRREGKSKMQVSRIGKYSRSDQEREMFDSLLAELNAVTALA